MNRFFSARVIPTIIAMITSVCLLTACDFQSERKAVDLKDRLSDEALREIHPENGDNGFIFGFDLRRSLKEDVRQYIPFLKYLENATGYRFKIRFTPKDARIADDLGKGLLQFAAVGADTYIEAREKYDAIPLVRGLNQYGKAEYQSVIVTALNSPIKRIEDVRGKRFAFGNITSTQGHLIPRIVLAQHGIGLDELGAYAWTGSHHNCANAVAKGNFDVGGMQDTLGHELEKAGIIRIIYTSKYYPSSGIAANKDVPADVRAKVKQALLDFEPKGQHSEGLHQWDKTEMPNGFIEAQDGDYAELRVWSLKLGLLNTKK